MQYRKLLKFRQSVKFFIFLLYCNLTQPINYGQVSLELNKKITIFLYYTLAKSQSFFKLPNFTH